MVPTILIADDDAAIRDVLAQILTSEGYDVRCVANGAAAIERIAEAHPELVLSDVMMPVLDGLSLLARLRARGETMPVVLMSAVAQRPPVSDVRFVVKPFDLPQLLATIVSALNDRLDHGASGPPAPCSGFDAETTASA